MPLDEPRFRSSFLPFLSSPPDHGYFGITAVPSVNLDCVHTFCPGRIYTTCTGPPAHHIPAESPPHRLKTPREPTSQTETQSATQRLIEKGGHICTMPPRSSLTSSFSVTDANNEVICPLKNNDRSSCRKRCTGVSSLCLLVCLLRHSPSEHLLSSPTLLLSR